MIKTMTMNSSVVYRALEFVLWDPIPHPPIQGS